MNTEIVNKIPSITDLATTTVFNTKVTDIENKITHFINIVAKAALNTKATEIQNKLYNTSSFVTTSYFNWLTLLIFNETMEDAKKTCTCKTEVKMCLM